MKLLGFAGNGAQAHVFITDDRFFSRDAVLRLLAFKSTTGSDSIACTSNNNEAMHNI